MRLRSGTLLAASALALAATGCAAVSTSAYLTAPVRPPSAAPVAVQVTRDPEAAEELGVVEASARVGWAPLEEVVAALRARTASLGGDLVRVDAFGTRYETVLERYSYDCGTDEVVYETRTVSRLEPDGTSTTTTETTPVTKHVERTCEGLRDVEIGTFTLSGRAFHRRSLP